MPAKKKVPDQSVVSQGLPKKGGDPGAGDQITEDIKKFKLAKDKFSANYNILKRRGNLFISKRVIYLIS